jgi:hypothetical protein
MAKTVIVLPMFLHITGVTGMHQDTRFIDCYGALVMIFKGLAHDHNPPDLHLPVFNS